MKRLQAREPLREGENICYEVMDACVPVMRPPPGAKQEAFVHRAKFSAVTKESIENAMTSLGSPNRNEALAVDARQELDLKIGVAFTRFQTRFFQGKYGNLDASVISYGPCQTPTLNFTVARHLEIMRHTPEAFWSLEVEARAPKLGRNLSLAWDRGRVFDADVGELFRRMVSDAKLAKVEEMSDKEERRARPGGLNTVEMLKAASAGMGMGAHHAMQIAERLYIQGYISYPRTESTAGGSQKCSLFSGLDLARLHPSFGDVNVKDETHRGV